MKTRLLTLAALGWAATAMAGDWKLPAVPTISYDPAECSDPEVGGEYYLFNTAAGQFLCGGNGWNTQASVSTEGISFVIDELTSTFDGNSTGYGLKNQRSDKKDKYLFYDKGGSSFIDMGNQNESHYDCNMWNFFAQADGTYKIQIVPTCYWEEEVEGEMVEHKTYVQTEYFGWVSNGKNAQNGGQSATVVMPGVDPDNTDLGEAGVFWKFLSVEQYAAQADAYQAAIDVWKEEYKFYDSKLALYNKMNEAEAMEVNTDAAEAVYNSATTIEELEAAYQALHEEMLKNASPEQPIEMTDKVQNPSFDGNIDGWVNEMGGQNKGYQGAAYSNSETGSSISKFAESWSPGKAQDDGQLYQVVSDLPAGLYRLEADVIASWQPDENVEVHGVQLFGQGGSARYTTECATANGKPQHFTVEFNVTGGEATIGIQTVSCNANWVAFDNVKLFYLGPVENAAWQDFVMLRETLDGYEVSDGSYYLYSAATEAERLALIQECANASESSSEDELAELSDRIAEIKALIKAEQEAYVRLNELYQTCEEASGTYGDIEVVGDEISELLEELIDALEEGSYSIDDIDAAYEKYNKIITEDLPQHITEGTDLTVMLQNPDFNNGNAKGWSGDLPTVQNGCAEFYQKNFDMYQDLTGLPNGLYEVSLSGFVRQGFIEAAGANYLAGVEEIRASIYGQTGMEGGNMLEKATKFPSLPASSDTETHYTSKDDAIALEINPGDTNYDNSFTDDDGNERYCANGMTGFAVWKTVYPERFKTSAKIFVSDGTMRVGIRCTDWHDNGFWCIFDDFKLTYVSKDMGNALKESVEEALTELITRRDMMLQNQVLPTDICEAIDALQVALDEANDDAAIEDVSNRVNETSELLKAIAAEVNDLIEKYDYYSQMVGEIESSDPGNLNGLIEELYNRCSPDGEGWETTADMRADAAKLVAGWTEYIFDGRTEASEKEPVDVSEIIVNRGFFFNNDNSDYGWSGADGSHNNNEYEHYSRKFDMYQTIVGLPVGYYELQVQGFYRMGFPDKAAVNEENYEGLARLYANVGGSTWETPMMSIFNNASTESISSGEVDCDVTVGGETVKYYIPNNMEAAQNHFMYDPEYTGEDNMGFYRGNKVQFKVEADQTAKLGIKKDSVLEGDWTIFDNFQLFYLGTTAPDAVKGIVAGTAVSQKYFTVGGVQLARPQRGVNIVTTTLSDGSKVTTKVLVK